MLSGSFGEGHVPINGLNEMIRVVKEGGFVFIVMRKEYLSYVKEYVNRLEPLMHRLEVEKKWTRVANFEVDNYFCNKTGKVFVFKKNLID